MDERPLQPLEELIAEALDPRALRISLGLPHPMSKFAMNGGVKEGPYVDGILNFLHDAVWEAPESMRYRTARWFLLESEMAFFFACSEAGIDAEKLRSHLLRCQSGGKRRARP